MDNDRSELYSEVEQRLEFLQFRQSWAGQLSQRELMNQSGISVHQSAASPSSDICFALGPIAYAKSERKSVCGSNFRRQFRVTHAKRHIARPRSIAKGTRDRETSSIADLPPCATAPPAIHDSENELRRTRVSRSVNYIAGPEGSP